MNRMSFIAILIAIISIFPSNGKSENISILFVGDSHSNLNPGGPRDANLQGSIGGIARAATVVLQEKMSNPENTLFFHAGDFSIGNFFYNVHFGVPELVMLNSMGCDAMVLGNHEADLGINTLNTIYTNAQSQLQTPLFPFISSNLIRINDNDWQELSAHTIPFKTFVKGNEGFKIGVFWLTHPWGNMGLDDSKAAFAADYSQIIPQVINALKSQGCNAIVMLSHLGVYNDSAIVRQFDGIDLVIAAHDHYTWKHPLKVKSPSGDKVPIVQAGAFYENIGKVNIHYNKHTKKINNISFCMIPLNSDIPEQTAFKSIVEGLKYQIEQIHGPVFTQQIGTAHTEIFEQSTLNMILRDSVYTAAGNLVCDAFRGFGQTQIAVTPNGSICQKINRGPITREDVFKFVGYGYNTVNGKGFRVNTFKLYGAYILGFLQNGLNEMNISDDFLVQASGLRYTCAKDKNTGNIHLISAKIDGFDIEPYAEYTVTANEYVLGYLDLQNIPYTVIGNFNPDMTEYDIIVNYILNSPDFLSKQQENFLPNDEYFSKINQTASPNPCYDLIDISFELGLAEPYTIEIYNSSGILIKTLSGISAGKSKEHNLINTSDFAAGVYFYNIIFNSNRISGQFVKIK